MKRELRYLNLEDVIASRYESVHDIVNEVDIQRLGKPFILLLGPSGVGKTTLIQALNEEMDNQLRYVSPYTTRPLREGETDKVSVSHEEFHRMHAQGMFIYVKQLYGNFYGTPLHDVRQIYNDGNIPILDFPISDLHLLPHSEMTFLPIYILPPSIALWYEQLRNCGRTHFSRLKTGMMELVSLLEQPCQAPNLDYVRLFVTNRPGEPELAARKIVDYLHELDLADSKRASAC